MPTVFISHSRKDGAFVEKTLLPAVVSAGVRYWYSPSDIQTAEEWDRSILRGLETSEWFLVVMSPNAAASDWVKAEVHWALENRSGRVVPVMLRYCNPADIHLKLLRIQFVDFRRNRNGAAEKLKKVWRNNGSSIRDSSSPPPPGPPTAQGDNDDFSRDDEIVWIKFRSEKGDASWLQLWELKAFHEWLHDRRDLEVGMSIWAESKKLGHGLDGEIEEIKIKAE